jgi:hypothetical protein
LPEIVEVAMRRKKVVSNKLGNDLRRLDGDMVEVSLLLSSNQAGPLEQEARRRGFTTGQLVRSIIRDYFLSQTVFRRN